MLHFEEKYDILGKNKKAEVEEFCVVVCSFFYVIHMKEYRAKGKYLDYLHTCI